MDYDELLAKPLDQLNESDLAQAVKNATKAGLNRAKFALSESGGSDWFDKPVKVDEYVFYVIQDDDFSNSIPLAYKSYWSDSALEDDPRVNAFMSQWSAYMNEESARQAE